MAKSDVTGHSHPDEVSGFRRTARRLGALREKIGGQAHHPEPVPESVVVRNADQEALGAWVGTCYRVCL